MTARSGRIEARTLSALDFIVLSGSAADFGKLAEETQKWGKVIRAANIKAE
jgi:hypothetical protein